MALFSTNPLPNLFGSNPFAALQEHMEAVSETVNHMPSMFQAAIAGDDETVIRAKEAVFQSEEEADKLKNKLRDHLPRSLFMPVGRRDLLEILDFQDSIADVAQDIAELLVERRMTVPAPMQEILLDFVRKSVDVCVLHAEIVEELDDLLATGFGGKEAEKVGAMMDKVNLLEDESDVLGSSLKRRLFEIEEELSPVSVMFWFKMIQWIGDLADYAEKASNRMRLILAN
jgi:predicted phosphate transport protein (TIGR00153 family)